MRQDGITCAEGDKSTCSTSHMKSKTFTIGFNGNVDPGVWISGGFTVSESITTGESSGCNGGPDDTVCVWWRTAFTYVGNVLSWLTTHAKYDYHLAPTRSSGTNISRAIILRLPASQSATHLSFGLQTQTTLEVTTFVP